MTLEELEVVISANARQFNSQVAQVQSKVDSMASRVNSSVNGMSGTFDKLGRVIGSVLAIGAIAKFTKSCLDLGSNLTEVQNVVDVTFGSMNTKVNEFAESAWKTVGLSETMAKQYMGNFGAMSKSMGFSTEAAVEMSETLTKLSGDVASFYNIRQDEAYTKLKSVYTGETETLKELGVVMTQENLNQYALANGYGKTTEEMNQQEKVALRLAYVTQTLSAASGDFARTSGGWANQVRLLSLQYQSLKANIGQGLIAVLTPVINVINTIMAKLVAMSSTFNSVLSSLGFKMQSSSGSALGASSGVDTTTDAMNNLSGATDGVGKSADKAKKKLQALMNIDEINKVNSSDSESGSGASGAGVGVMTSQAVDTSVTEQSINEFADRINNVLQELLSPLKDAWRNYGEWFLSKWEYFKNAFGYSCDALKNFLVSVWNNGGKEFVQHLGEIGIAIGGVALQIGGEILVALGRLWEYLNPDNNPYTRKFIDSMNSLVVAVRDFVISAGNWFGKFLDLGGQAFINVIGDIVMLVGTILAEIMRDAINFITAFMNSWAGSAIIGAVALTLNIVAGAIKAVIIVIEKCKYVLEVLIAVWAAWKIQDTAKNILVTNNAIGRLYSKLSGLAAALLTQITLCKEWAISISKTATKALQDFGGSLKKNLLALKEWIVATGVKSIQSIKSFVASLGFSIAGLLGLTGAEGAATAGATALNIALGAMGIGVIIAAVSGLIVVVKKIGDKFGWWTSISNALGAVMDWVADKIGWLWDGIASFFGWDEEPEAKENIEEVGEVAEETAKTTDEAFGTATSNVNRYLESIHFNATKLASEVDEATKTATEKFGMLSKTAQEYLDAVATHNQDKLNEMSGSQSLYNEEVKAMYADLTEAEKNEFMKRYGIIQGINDDMLNYEGLTYDERVARHSAYLATIENDEALSYQEKKAKMDQANLDFQTNLDAEVQKYKDSMESKRNALNELYVTHGESTEEGKRLEQELTDSIEADRLKIQELTTSTYGDQVSTVEEATEAMKKANGDNAAAQEETYTNLATTVDKSMATINESLSGAKENIQTFAKDSNQLAIKLRSAFDGVGNKIASEFASASISITNVISQIQNLVTNTASNINNIISNAFDSIQRTVDRSTSNLLSRFQATCLELVRLTSNLADIMSRGFNVIERASDTEFNRVQRNIKSNMDQAYRNVANCINDIKSLFNNFNATLRVKVPHFYMTGEFNAETKEVPRVGVNYFAKGGVVERATLGIFGEAGKEAIVPLQNNTEWMDILKEIMGSAFTQALQINSSNSNDSSTDGDLTLIIDGDVIGKVALKKLRRMQRQGGLTLIPT